MNDTTRTRLDDLKDAKAKRAADLVAEQRRISELEKQLKEVTAEKEAAARKQPPDKTKFQALRKQSDELKGEIEMHKIIVEDMAKASGYDPAEVRKVWEEIVEAFKKKAVLAYADYKNKDREACASYFRCLEIQEEAAALRLEAAKMAGVQNNGTIYDLDTNLAAAGFPLAPACVPRREGISTVLDQGVRSTPAFIHFSDVANLTPERRQRLANLVNLRA